MSRSIDPDTLTEHLEGVRRLARTLVRDDSEADDVVQDTMVAALENRARVRSGLRGWLAGVARNMARRKARSAGRRARHEREAAAGATVAATADVVVRAAEQSRMLDLLVRMDEPYRSAVLLRYVEELPPRVIARRMGLPVETVRTHVKRGLQRLRDELDEKHGRHAGERRAALALAASEPLGAAHARAVALARASGLVVLLCVGGGLLWWLWREPTAEPGRPPAPMIVDGEEVRPPVAARQSTPEPLPAPARPVSGSPPEPGAPALADAPGATDVEPPRPSPPEAGSRTPPTRPPAPEVRPVPSRPPLPEPHVAVEQPGARKKDGGSQEGDAEGDEPGEFYEGETSFSRKQVDEAIGKGLVWLKKRQGHDGGWGSIRFNSTYDGEQRATEGMHAGPTALALYTLLKCKVPLNDEAVKRGFAFMEKHFEEPPSSYETSMLLLAVTATADSFKMLSTSRRRKVRPKLSGRYRRWATRLVDHLLDKREASGWRYNVRRGAVTPGGPEDLSSTQLAALALFAAHRLKVKVKDEVWEDILAFSLAQQEDDGPSVTYRDPLDPKKERSARARGFSYIKKAENEDEARPRGGMTACGLANVEMARFVLSDGGERREQWDARKDAATVQEAIYDGLAWLDRNWSPFSDPHAERRNVYHVYWLYALERAMDLFDLRLVGSHDWYNEMGQELLNRQHGAGHWDTKGQAGGHDVLDTCFALLFLKRATKGPIPFGSVTGGRAAPLDNR